MPSARSASRQPRLPLLRAAVAAVCLALVGAGVAGCETTQEKAAKQQARAAHILAAREERQKHRKAHRHSKRDHQEGKKR